MANSSEPPNSGQRFPMVDPRRLVAEISWLGLLSTASFVSLGLMLAVAGAFRPALVFPPSLALVVLLRIALAPPHRWIEPAHVAGSRRAAWVMLAIVAVAMGGNVRWAGQHHATNRDPGVYFESGLWLSQHSTLIVDGRTGPFLDDASLQGGGLGFDEMADGTGRLLPQFSHGTAVVIAAADQLGGIRLATRTGAVLVALASMLMWIVALRFVDDWWATLAVTIFSMSIITIHFARDTFSEPLAAVLVLGLLSVLLWSDRASYWGFAGVLAGLAVAARIDSILILVGVALVILATSWANQRRAIALTAGASAGFAVAMVDLVNRSPKYLSDKWPVFERAMLLGLAIIFAAGMMMALRNPLQRSKFAGWVRQVANCAARRGPGNAAGVMVTTTILVLLLLRPHFQHLHAGFNQHISGLQQRDGLAVDGTRTYGEETFHWLTWYFGWPLVILGSIGAGLGTRAVITGRSIEWAILGAVAAPVTILYLESPRISGDQIWAMRRFLPVAIPFFLILAVSSAARIHSEFVGPVQHGIAVVLGLALVVPTVMVTAPLAKDQTLWWSTSSIIDLCDHLPDDSAVLVSSVVEFGDQLIRPLSRECKVPAARGDIAPLDVGRLTTAWAQQGRRMVVLTSVYDPPYDLVPLQTVGLRQRYLQQVVERRPDSFEDGVLGVTISESMASSLGG